MECASENKRKCHGNESNIETGQSDKNESSALSNVQTDHNLISGLANDVVLGQVMRRLPWHNRPVFMALSRSWRNALTHHFPSYARLDHPRILGNSLVFFRTPVGQNPSNSQETLALWVYNRNNPNVRSLPVPRIPKPLHRNVKFFCDDDEERIYSFTFMSECRVYNVNVLDLREGNSRWKRLPYLPVTEDKYLFRCSYSALNNSYVIWMRSASDSSIEPQAFCMWTMSDNNDAERQWISQIVTRDLISNLNVFDAEKMPPLYVEIKREMQHLDGNPACIKYLYERCQQYVCIPDTIWWGAHYVVMFQDQDGGDQQPSFMDASYSLYHIVVSDGVQLYKSRVKDNSKRMVEQSEWRVFSESWSIEEEGGERSAMKVFVEGTDVVWARQSRTSQINIEVAQKPGSVYVYRLVRLTLSFEY